NGASLEIRNQGSLKLRPPTDGDLAGLVVAYERTSNRTLGWRGSRNEVTGTVYAPSAQLRFDGDASWSSTSRFIVGTASSQTSTVAIDTTTAAPNVGGSGAGDQGEEPPSVAASPLVIPEA